ncbi:metal ABC transporter substrate-binding protein [Paraburkholderia ginsengiterrae]|uniref:Metal ABC transporter substrate-binding protein n=1 Tax=Paraburkholderia ginsengiterrae TaxID=1462993 RepID=A0A1A9N2M3_9BURK|nr:MetQ/NlpA family lipoprotein [Paraburkholderia ginsengiterrae]OAJ54738.1 metal ABC transporter substrate-binding protein [Paraburkholderia ginsengiterrae]OAJ55509.1 metal ABC transporter substrate-binding protein [Paraburkholderia ginsengiterrae]
MTPRSFFAATLLLAALSAQDALAAASQVQVVKVGVTPGTHTQIMEQVRRVAASQGLTLDVVVFDQPERIDAALAAKQIDAASFEDEPHFEAQCKQHGYALTSVATTVTFPIALYSRKLTNLGQLQRGATIAIPDDREGTARALVLLQNYTLLTFRDSAGLHATLGDITSNRLNLKIRQVPRAQLFDTLNHVAFAVIDSDDAARAGLFPARDSLGLEDARSPYANVLTVRDADRTEPWVAQLVAAYHSNDVAHFILTRYQDSVRRPW